MSTKSNVRRALTVPLGLIMWLLAKPWTEADLSPYQYNPALFNWNFWCEICREPKGVIGDFPEGRPVCRRGHLMIWVDRSGKPME